jgi:hypothetical protein
MTNKVRWRAPAWTLFSIRDVGGELADDLPVAVSIEQIGPARILHLGIGEGHVSIAIALGKQPSATFSVPSAADGAACLDALAKWLDAPVPARPPRAVAVPPPTTVGTIDMGRGKGGRHSWQLVTLVLAYEARLYLIWRVAGTEAYLCEHGASDRAVLVDELAYILRDGVHAVPDRPSPARHYFVFDGERTNVLPTTWAQKLGLERAEVERRLEAAGRAHVAPIYRQIDTALDAWADDAHGAATRAMKIPVYGCVGAVWGAIAHREAESLTPDEVAALRIKLRSLAAADYVQRLYHHDEVRSLLLR